MALGDLNIQLSADTVKFMSDMGRAAHAVEGAIGKMQRGFGALQGAAAGLGLVFTAGAFVSGVKNIINQADEMGKLSQKVGVTVENLSALKYAAELSDVSMEGLTTGLKKLSTSMFEASTGNEEALRLFKGLNVEFQSAAGNLLPTDEVLLKIADKFSKMEDGAGKAAIAVKIFGRQGMDLVPFLNQGAAGIQKLKEELERLGGVMTGEMAKKAEEFNDNLKSLSVSANKLKIEIGNQALPALVEITEAMKRAAIEGGALNAVLAGAREAFIQLLPDPQLSRLKEVQSQIGQLQDKLALPGVGPNSPGRTRVQGQLNELIAEEARITQGLAGMGYYDGPAYKPARIQPDLSGFATDPKTKKVKAEANVAGQQWAWWQEEEAKIMAEAAQAADNMNARLRERERLEYKWNNDFIGMTTEEIKQWEKLQFEAIDYGVAFEESQMRITAGFDENGRAIERAKKVTQDWGFTFNSQIEEAILNFKSLGDVARAVVQDIARMAVRKTVVEPLGAAMSLGLNTLMSGIFGGVSGGQTGASESFGLTGRADGGAVMGGRAYMVGERGPEMFVPGVSGEIVPNHKMGGSVVIAPQVNFSANTPAAVREAVFALVPSIVEATKAGIRDARQRGAVV